MDPDELFPLDAEEARVLGCLIEKAMTTPDQYPMSLNAVRVACNQVSNRDPVVDYDETTVATTMRRLADRGLAKFVHRAGDRVVKYIHAADEVLGLSEREVALTAVLLLRGDQTPGELRQRTGRYVEFTSLPEVEVTLEELARRSPPLVTELERQPGQKEGRYRQLLTGDTPRAAAPPQAATEGTGDEIAELRDEIAELRDRFERLLTSLGVDDI
jgi:uncharacterized protein YceH (UPF0502 family)